MHKVSKEHNGKGVDSKQEGGCYSRTQSEKDKLFGMSGCDRDSRAVDDARSKTGVLGTMDLRKDSTVGTEFRNLSISTEKAADEKVHPDPGLNKQRNDEMSSVDTGSCSSTGLCSKGMAFDSLPECGKEIKDCAELGNGFHSNSSQSNKKEAPKRQGKEMSKMGNSIASPRTNCTSKQQLAYPCTRFVSGTHAPGCSASNHTSLRESKAAQLRNSFDKVNHKQDDKDQYDKTERKVTVKARPGNTVTIPKPFKLSGQKLQDRTNMAVEQKRRRISEMESRRVAFKARPMPESRNYTHRQSINIDEGKVSGSWACGQLSTTRTLILHTNNMVRCNRDFPVK